MVYLYMFVLSQIILAAIQFNQRIKSACICSPSKEDSLNYCISSHVYNFDLLALNLKEPGSFIRTILNSLITILFKKKFGAIVVMIIWQLGLQLSVQSVPITTKVVSSNPAHGEVYSIQHNVIKFVRDLRQVNSFFQVLQFPPPIKLTATI